MIEQEPLAERPILFSWAWRMRSPPEALWPLVSDTNRMNLLASMAPVRFEEAGRPEGGSDRTGHAKMLGLGVAWDEHPFEWAYPAGFSVRRDFQNGVMLAYRSSVSMTPLEDGGTRLAQLIELVPRTALVAPFIRREGQRLEKLWGAAYEAVDAYLAADGPWPFENAKPPRPGGAARELAGKLGEGAEDPELARRIFDHVMREHAHELGHIRPFVLADRWRADREAVLGAFEALARRALVRPQWSLLCPHCRGAKGTAATLAGLADQVHCQACNIAFGRYSDDVVELTFGPDPRYRQAQEASYCVGGPGSTPHICFQSRLMPGAGRDIGVTVPPGPYRLRAARLAGALDFHYHGAPAEAPEEPPEEPVATLGPDGPVLAGEPHLEGAKLRLRVVNETDHPQEIVVETRTWRDDVITLAWLKARPALLDALSDPRTGSSA